MLYIETCNEHVKNKNGWILRGSQTRTLKESADEPADSTDLPGSPAVMSRDHKDLPTRTTRQDDDRSEASVIICGVNQKDYLFPVVQLLGRRAGSHHPTRGVLLTNPAPVKHAPPTMIVLFCLVWLGFCTLKLELSEEKGEPQLRKHPHQTALKASLWDISMPNV